MYGEENAKYGHEEADVSLIAELKYLINQGYKAIYIHGDDTDIFVLLVFYCHKWQADVKMYMKLYCGAIIDINRTVDQLRDKCKILLAVHALTRCDTVSYLSGKGKNTAVKLLNKHQFESLQAFGESDADRDTLVEAGNNFIYCLYKDDNRGLTMNQTRHYLFCSKKDTPKIQSLPPTDDALLQHFLRAHYQAILWKFSDQLYPPELDITQFSWELINGLPSPPGILEVVACTCGTATPCSRKSCSCSKSEVSCTSYCKCESDVNCQNPHTRHMVATPDL